MLIVLTSPAAIEINGKPDPGVVAVLIAKSAQNPVAVVSNNSQPIWFDATFGGTKVQFLQARGRQSGKIIKANAEHFELNSYDVLVLAGSDVDLQMAKNGKAVVAAAGWVADVSLQNLGIRVATASEFDQLISLSSAWSGKWWFSADGLSYRVRALADLSQYHRSLDQQIFAGKVTSTVKGGGARLNALLAVTARSLLTDPFTVDTNFWAVYPSSSSDNSGNEILSDFMQRLRTTVSRVHFAERDQPLFIRHRQSQKRSSGGTVNRLDPSDQLLSLHVNPYYKKQIRGRNVVVVDDCVSYGVSFGVAAGLLLAAGAKSVTGIALGKFGNQLHEFQILVSGNPFEPLKVTDFTFKVIGGFTGATDSNLQASLLTLIP